MNAKDSSSSDYLSHIIFITGGTKSGKSEFAEHLAKGSKKLSYVALSDNNVQDKKWQEKINLHRQRRPKNWVLIETTDLIKTLNKQSGWVTRKVNESHFSRDRLLACMFGKKPYKLTFEFRAAPTIPATSWPQQVASSPSWLGLTGSYFDSECAMRREHRRPRIWRSAFVAADCILQLAISRSNLRAICFC